MSRNILLFAVILCATPVSGARLDRMIFWNVGQGLWVTWSTPGACIHFDIGGEFLDVSTVHEECAGKSNFAVFSHWDWDHINLARRFERIVGTVCVLEAPGGPGAPKKINFLSRLRPCPNKSMAPDHELKFSFVGKRPNGFSRVFIQRQVLLPGDSESKQERTWSRLLKYPKKIRVLAMGHHGSKTSTSQDLLKRLPSLKMAIASARSSRYGHPHPSVVKRLKQFGVSTLSTETWGHLIVNAPKTDGIPFPGHARQPHSKRSRHIHSAL